MDNNIGSQSSEVYVGNLPHEITEDELIDSGFFENCTILRLIKKDIKAFCFVDCGSHENAIKFAETVNGLQLRGRNMRVKINDRAKTNTRKELNVSYDSGSNDYKPAFKNESQVSPIPHKAEHYVSKNSQENHTFDDGPPPLRPSSAYKSTKNNLRQDHVSPSEHYSSHRSFDATRENSKCMTCSNATYESSKLGTKLKHPCHCTLSQNSSVQTHSAHNYCSPVPISEPIPSSRRSVDGHSYRQDEGRNIRDIKYGAANCTVDNTHNFSVPQHQEHRHNVYYNQKNIYSEKEEGNSHFRGSYGAPRKTFSQHDDRKPDFNQPEYRSPQSYLHKQTRGGFRQLGNRSYQDNQLNNRVQYSNEEVIAQSRRENFLSNNPKRFTRPSTFQSMSGIERNESEVRDNVISRITELRRQQMNSHKYTNSQSYDPTNNAKYLSKESNSRQVFSKEYVYPASQSNFTEEATEDSEEEYEPIVLSVANFPFGTTEDMIFKLFEDYEPIEVTMLCNEPAEIPTEAFVAFADEECAVNAVMELDNTIYRRRTIFVSDVSDDSVLEELRVL